MFDALRDLRKQIAIDIRQPAYIVFGDKTLRDMARRRPSTAAGLLQVRGVGTQKLAEYGEQFLAEINRYSQQAGLTRDVQ